MSISITQTIKTDKAATFLEGFLASFPNNMTIVDPEDETKRIAKYTDKQWVNVCTKRWQAQSAQRGRQRLARKTATVDNDIHE